jgi:hypothetical protein
MWSKMAPLSISTLRSRVVSDRSRFSESHLMITSTSALRAEPAFSSSRVGPCRSCLKRLLHCSVCKYTFRVSFFIFHDGYKFNTPQSIGAYNNTAPEWNKNWWKREKGWKRRTEKYLMLQLRDVEVLELFFFGQKRFEVLTLRWRKKSRRLTCNTPNDTFVRGHLCDWNIEFLGELH